MRGRTGLDIAKPLSGACGCRTGGRDWIKENPQIRHPRVVGKLLTEPVRRNPLIQWEVRRTKFSNVK